MRISASRVAFSEILGIDSSALLPEEVIQKYPQLHQILTCVFFVLRCFAPTGRRSAMPRRHAWPETAVHPFDRAHCSEKLKARPPTDTKTPGQSHPASVTEFGIRPAAARLTGPQRTGGIGGSPRARLHNSRHRPAAAGSAPPCGGAFRRTRQVCLYAALPDQPSGS